MCATSTSIISIKPIYLLHPTNLTNAIFYDCSKLNISIWKSTFYGPTLYTVSKIRSHYGDLGENGKKSQIQRYKNI